jgi:pimeloyl-[acyl-carrier protein] methyl ester esterase
MDLKISLMLVTSLTLAAPAFANTADQNRLSSSSQLISADRLSVEVIGKGPDVVLIPGLASSRQVWQRTAARLSGRFRLHVVQVAGFAGEPPRANATGPVVGPTVNAIASYIATAKLNRPAIIGHSLGGLMALELAADHPGSVGKVFVVDALPFYAEIFAGPAATVAAVKPIADGMGAKMLASSDSDFAASAAQTASMMVTSKEDQARVAGWSASSNRQTMITAMQEDLTTDFRSRVASIEAPVTVIYEAPLKALVEQDYGHLKHGTLIPEPAGVKHFVMYDDPTGFDKALDAFLISSK